MLEGFLLATQADRPLCAPLHQIEEVLSNYRERPLVAGRIENGNMLVIYSSPTGTWTAIIIAPNGIACVGPVGTDIKPVSRGT